MATVTDRSGAPSLEVRHLKRWKSRITVTDPHGREIGSIRQKSLTFKPSSELSAGHRSYGRVRSDGSRLLGLDIIDASGAVYGRMRKVGSSFYGVRQYHAGMAVGLPPATVGLPSTFVVQFFRRPDHLQLAPIIPLGWVCR